MYHTSFSCVWGRNIFFYCRKHFKSNEPLAVWWNSSTRLEYHIIVMQYQVSKTLKTLILINGFHAFTSAEVDSMLSLNLWQLDGSVVIHLHPFDPSTPTWKHKTIIPTLCYLLTRLQCLLKMLVYMCVQAGRLSKIYTDYSTIHMPETKKTLKFLLFYYSSVLWNPLKLQFKGPILYPFSDINFSAWTCGAALRD